MLLFPKLSDHNRVILRSVAATFDTPAMAEARLNNLTKTLLAQGMTQDAMSDWLQAQAMQPVE